MSAAATDEGNPFDSMTTEELAAHIRIEEFSCRSLHRVFALAKAVRRAARLSIDPCYPDDLIEFDDELDTACKQLAKVVHLLVTIRERVDTDKIDEARGVRSKAFARRATRRKLYLAATPRKVVRGMSGKTLLQKAKGLLEQSTQAEIRAMLEELNNEQQPSDV
jgi:hypothetical protein